MGGIGLALVAGILSTLSPCVLPLLPIVVATALGEHRLGPVALAAGLALAFVLVGLFVATVGFATALDHEVFRSREALMKWRDRMLAAGRNGKAVLGLLLAGVGVLILSGAWRPCWSRRCRSG